MTLVRLLPKAENRTYTKTWQPKADIVESKDGFTVTLDVPGFAKEDLKVKAHDGLLTVRGTKRSRIQNCSVTTNVLPERLNVLSGCLSILKQSPSTESMKMVF